MIRKKRTIAVLVIGIASAVAYYLMLPKKLFNDPYSTIIEANDGQLLTASIASDGQWRFPIADSIPEKFKVALVAFEDKRFWNHPGVDVVAIGRAMKQNLAAGKIVSGGSTITMQVARLSNGSPRTLLAKAYEAILATRLELAYSKEEILETYAAHAPFGGNVVGLQAACWRYFGINPRDLSWAQAALLAVLPNAPSLMHPGKNRERLKEKRDRLLERLKELGHFDDFTLALAKEEPLPDKPYPLPRHAAHLLIRLAADGRTGQHIRSTVDFQLQNRVEQILDDHHQRLRANHVYNGAVLVLDVRTGKVLAYAGNVTSDASHENHVDNISSNRSTGSILKPFLHAAMLQEGKILPGSLLPDVPVLINGFAPKNFSQGYDGAVFADQALIRSLNVPAVHMLRDFRYEKFHTLLKRMGMTTLNRPADHYGLSLILGGAEGSLWDITGMYASLGRTLNNYFEYAGALRYHRSDFHQAIYDDNKALTPESPREATSFLSAASIWLTLEALKEVYRPGEETGWRYFSNAKEIAWKTGTSFGHRDAWAVGLTPDYAVGVWIGNADGEGRPGLTGTEAAAPVMFDVFSSLPTRTNWFDKPMPELRDAIICSASGNLASPACEKRDTVLVTVRGVNTNPCPYHKIVHLSADERYRVHDGCAPTTSMRHLPWFVLPPVQEYYYRNNHTSYKPLPPFKEGCEVASPIASMEMVYPRDHSKLFIPRELDGQDGRSVFQLAHRNPRATVFWHLDGNFIGSTSGRHVMPISSAGGKHVLTLVDDVGTTLERRFEVVTSAD